MPDASPEDSVIITVCDPDTVGGVAVIYRGLWSEGDHTILWDGTGGPGGDPLPNGDYPYSLVYVDMSECHGWQTGYLTATIFCDTSADPDTWGNIKARFGD